MIHTTTSQLTGQFVTSRSTIGRYRIVANPRPTDCGRFLAQVSIASGQGSASTARVMRFDEAFSTHEAAASFGHEEGVRWVRARQVPDAQAPQPPATDRPVLM